MMWAHPEARHDLTKRQKEVLDFLVSFSNKHGYSPSFEEIARSLKLTSLATVHKHITTLERKGFIRRGYNQSRSIEVMQLPKPVREQVLERHTVELPMMGRIAAGRPLEAVEERETLSLGEFARSDNTFVLQVKGNSMIDDHIMNGDYVVIEPTQVANPGEIVVALVGNDEATLKRFYREAGGKIRLQPANSEMAADHCAGRGSEDSGPRGWRAAKVLARAPHLSVTSKQHFFVALLFAFL